MERWNRLHPDAEPRAALVTEALARDRDPVVAVTDFMRTVPDQVARWVARPFTSLGTDGFGRSDAREVLRRYFEVDAAHVVVAVLQQLALAGRDGAHGGGRGDRRLRHRPRRAWPRSPSEPYAERRRSAGAGVVSGRPRHRGR